jgi:ATP-dependent RNA helicase RhlE
VLQRKGQAITFVTEKDMREFGKIESLIGYAVNKLPLPESFGTGPEYKAEGVKRSSSNGNRRGSGGGGHRGGNSGGGRSGGGRSGGGKALTRLELVLCGF